LKPVEVKEKTTNELVRLTSDLEGEIFKLRFRLNSGQLKSTSDIKKKRRDLARVKTVLRQRELESANK
jgi:large subunit ribosomal protein L29